MTNGCEHKFVGLGGVCITQKTKQGEYSQAVFGIFCEKCGEIWAEAPNIR